MSKGDADAADRDAADEPFLQRWSRLKSSTRDTGRSAVQPDDTTPPSPAAEGQPAPPPSAEGTGPTGITLPDLESLGPDSDYSAFLGPDVDLSLRRAALRKLFRSPKFNVLDGLDDYCDDFTQFAPLAGIVTADMRHHVERAARELLSSEERKQPSLPTDDEPRPRLPDAAADNAATRAPADDTAAASGIVSGDTADPATEEPEEDADRRPA
ncbi:MAG: DUF3306 domain-containing protein [Steroidobacteraceae bacterium]|nr:DUF3306 domain-containing protein [Steroidobacteraceae bacterium]